MLARMDDTRCPVTGPVPYKLDGEAVTIYSDCLRSPGHDGDHYNGRFYWREGDDGWGTWTRDT